MIVTDNEIDEFVKVAFAAAAYETTAKNFPEMKIGDVKKTIDKAYLEFAKKREGLMK